MSKVIHIDDEVKSIKESDYNDGVKSIKESNDNDGVKSIKESEPERRRSNTEMDSEKVVLFQNKNQSPSEGNTKYELSRTNFVETFILWIRIFLRLLPSVLGLVDVATDYFYYATQPFAHASIKEAVLFYILFTPFLQTIIWDVYFSILSYSERDKTQYEQRQKKYFLFEVKKKSLEKKGRKNGYAYILLSLKSIFYLLWIYFREGVTFIFIMGYYIFQAFLYAILQECKLLPYYIAFFDSVMRRVRYPITKQLVQEFRGKEIILNSIIEIEKQNILIEIINQEIANYNRLKQPNQPEKPLKLKLNTPQIYTTNPLKAAEILNCEKSFMNQVLNDPYIASFLFVGELNKAVFESLPMLTLQFINNSILSLWSNYFNIISFIFSLLMVTINCCKMTYAVSENETFPLMKLKNFIKIKLDKGNMDRIEDPLWIIQSDKNEMFHIFDIESLKKAAEATPTFYKTIKGIHLDITANPKFITDCLEGPLYPVYCLANIMKNMNQNNDFRLILSNNSALTEQHLEILFNSFTNSTMNCLEIDLSHSDIENTSFLSGLQHVGAIETLIIDLKYNNITDISVLESCLHLSLVKNFTINLMRNKLEDISALQSLRYMTCVVELTIDLSSNKIEDISSLGCLSQLVQLQVLIIQLNDNYVEDLSILNGLNTLTLLRTLRLSFQTSSRYIEDIPMDFLEQLILLTDLQLSFSDNKVKEISSFKHLGLLKKLQNFKISIVKTEFNDASVFSGLKDLTQIRTLEINLDSNYITNIEFMRDFRFKDLTDVQLNFRYHDLEDVSQLQSLQNSSRIKSMIIDLSKNKITDLSCFNFSNYTALEHLNLNLTQNKLEDINFITHLNQSVNLLSLELSIGKNSFTDTTPLKSIGKLNCLKKLKLDFWCNNNISDISFILDLNNSYLSDLDLSLQCNRITDLSPLKKIGEFIHLIKLSLQFGYQANYLEDAKTLDFLDNLVDLEELNIGLSQNSICDQSHLPKVELFKNLTKLRKFELDLRSNRMVGLELYLDSVLSYLTSLTHIQLQLTDNDVVDSKFLNRIIPMKTLLEIYICYNQEEFREYRAIEQYLYKNQYQYENQ